MKTISLSAFSAFLLAFLFLLPRQSVAQAGQLLFTAHLTGAEEVPAVTTNGEALITVLVNDDQTKMLIQGVATNLSGPVTAAHLHAGDFGVNGGVFVDLSPIRTGNKFAGELPIPAGFLTKALSLGLYANVHTAMHPGGEIRGQLQPESDYNFVAVLTGLNEVPPVLTTAIGLGGLNLTLGHNMVQYRFTVNGLSGPITASHIHKGAVGVAGPVVRALSFNGNNLVGELPLDSLPADFLLNLFSGAYYVNVHTAANPAGEIRGQLGFADFLNGFAIMNGDQETPPVTTGGFGIGFAVPNLTLDSLVYGVLVNGLSGPATAAHIHKAAAGVAGSVQVALTATTLPGLYSATVPMSAGMLSDFIHNNLYFNVHTAANPGGEIRGQIQTNLRKGYTFDLCATQEAPSNPSTAFGAGMVSIDQGNLTLNYQVLADGLSGPATAAHIHNGVAGVSGGVWHAITTPNPYSEGSFAITGADAVLIENQAKYMNIHTAANPGGEIRGQVLRTLSCSAASAVFDPVISALEVFPNPATDVLHIRFDSQEAFRGQLRLTDVSGRTVLEQTAEAAGSGLQEWTFPVNTLAPGMYFLHLTQGGNRMFVQSVVKM